MKLWITEYTHSYFVTSVYIVVYMAIEHNLDPILCEHDPLSIVGSCVLQSEWCMNEPASLVIVWYESAGEWGVNA